MTAQSKPKGLILDPLQFVDQGLGVCWEDDKSGIAKEGFDVSLMGDEEALLIFAKQSAGQGPHYVQARRCFFHNGHGVSGEREEDRRRRQEALDFSQLVLVPLQS